MEASLYPVMVALVHGRKVHGPKTIDPKGLTICPKGLTIGPKGLTIGPQGLTIIGPNQTLRPKGLLRRPKGLLIGLFPHRQGIGPTGSLNGTMGSTEVGSHDG